MRSAVFPTPTSITMSRTCLQLARSPACMVTHQSFSCVCFANNRTFRWRIPTVSTPSVSVSSSVSSSNLIYLTGFELRDDWRHIKYSFRARNALPTVAQRISENRGVRWSVMNYLPAWLPAQSSLIEFMHAVFLSKLHLLLLFSHINVLSKPSLPMSAARSFSNVGCLMVLEPSSQWSEYKTFSNQSYGQLRRHDYLHLCIDYNIFTYLRTHSTCILVHCRQRISKGRPMAKYADCPFRHPLCCVGI